MSSVVSNILTTGAILVTMFYVSWQISLVALVLIPLFILPAKRVGRRLQRLTRESMQLDAAMGSTMTERFNVAGAMLVKLFGRPREESEVFAERAGRVRDIGVSQAMYGQVFFISLSLLAALATAVVYGLGGTLVIHGVLQLGLLVTLSGLLARVYGPITGLSNVQISVMTALVSFDRVFEVLDLKPLIAERPDAEVLPAEGAGQAAPPRDPVRPGVIPVPVGLRGIARLAGVDRAARPRTPGLRGRGLARGELHGPVRPADRAGRPVRARERPRSPRWPRGCMTRTRARSASAGTTCGRSRWSHCTTSSAW